MNETTQTDPTSYVELIRNNSDFRLLWFGQIVSLFGDWFNLIASAALVATLTSSGFAVGGLFIVRMLAPFLTSPIAGIVADRYNRKHVLFWADIVRGCTVFGFLLVRDANSVWLVYVLTAVQLGISGFFFTARSAILPDLVESRAVGTANAITSATWSAMLALGAAAGGLVAGTLGVYPAFVIDGISFFASSVFIAAITLNTTPPIREHDHTLASVFAEYGAGFRWLCGHPDMLLISLHKSMLMLFFGSTFQVVQVAVAESLFPVGDKGSLSVGLLFATVGVGTGISPLVARWFSRDRENLLRATIFFGYLVSATGLVVASRLTSMTVAVSGALCVGLGNGLLWVFSTQLLLQLAPAKIRGRVFATEFAFFSLTSALGAAIAGAALDQSLGITELLRWMACFSLAPASVWGLWTLFSTTSTGTRAERPKDLTSTAKMDF